MGIFNFFKKQKQQVEIIPEKLPFKDIELFIQNKKQELKTQDFTFLNKINNLIKELIKNLNETIDSAKNINLDKKRAEERVKIIVQQNLENYIYNVEELINNLNDLNKLDSSRNIIKEINILFFNFQKKSEPSFQKATFLIGEIGEIQEKINESLMEFDKLINQNQPLIDTLNTLESINEKLNQLSKIKDMIIEINTEIKSYEGKIINLKQKVRDLELIIEEIKKKNEYKEEINKQEKAKIKHQELERLIYSLKGLINLKILANIFHKNEKEMNIIKKYKDNFYKAFQRNHESLIEIINLTNQIENKPAINEKIELIIRLKNDTKKLTNSPTIIINEIESKNSEINKLNNNIEDINDNIEKVKKRYEKTKIAEKQELEKLKIEFKELNVEIL